MKPTLDLEAALLANEDRFDDPFFRRFTLRPGPPLALAEGITKEYRFPTFYGDVTCAIAIFLCDYERAAAMMPHPTLRPVSMPRAKGVVIISCYEYRNVMNVRPYNEIAMTIPVMAGPGWNPPLLPLMTNPRRKGYYVFSMPVTSLENQIRGTKIWGLPKVVEEIDISTDGDHCTTFARDGDGVAYLELRVPKAGRRKAFDETGHLYSVREGRLLRSVTCFKGDFAVTTRVSRLFGAGGGGAPPALKLGDSPRAQPLRDLAIEEHPFQLRFATTMNSCFDLPVAE